jgi:hypothetical protein
VKDRLAKWNDTCDPKDGDDIDINDHEVKNNYLLSK